jgi:small subunit ribosomal protein S8
MDKVGEFLTRIRNAGMARHEKVDIPASRIRVAIANVLKDSGYIKNFKVVKDGRQGMMRLYLKYDDQGRHAITAIVRQSTPGRRLYFQSDRIPNVRSGYGMAVISTSKGLMSGKQAAEQKVGGELICTLW